MAEHAPDGSADSSSQSRRTSRQRDKIFISYRRSDSGPWVGRLADDLRNYFGRDRVYRDLDSNRSAEDYVPQIEDALEESRVVIAVLGPQWLTTRDEAGHRRLDNPEDRVRLELERSFVSEIAVVSVLAGQATVPPERELPPSLQKLSRLQAQKLTDEDWEYDFGRLLETLDRHGVVRSIAPTQEVAPAGKQTVARVQRYERTFHATRRRSYDALAGALDELGYDRIEESPQSAQITFQISAPARTTKRITAKVIDVGPGLSKVVLEFLSLKSGALTAGSLAALAVGSMVPVILPVAALGWATRAWERRFAVGFLTNVEGILEGRGISEDSALLPGVTEWRNRSREV